MPNQGSTCENHKLGLVTELLRSGATVRLNVLGSSMLPSLWPGDVLTVQRAGHEEVDPGDILLIVRNGRPFVHRLLRKTGLPECPELVLRGDAMPQDDPPAQTTQLLGKVFAIERNHRYVVPKRRAGPMSRLWALALCHWDLFRNLALRIHLMRQGNWLHRSS